MNKNGFTLIELMVVVLIISVLAAIAVPEYLKSVEKARSTEAIQFNSAISKAVTTYYAEKDECPSRILDLPTDIDYKSASEDGTEIVVSDFSYKVNSDCFVVAQRKNVPADEQYKIITISLNASVSAFGRNLLGKTVCTAPEGNEGEKTCAQLAANEKFACPYGLSTSDVCYLF